MNHFSKIVFLGAALGFASMAEARTVRVRCESIGHDYRECYVGGDVTDAELVNQLSNARCRRGDSWGYSRHDDYIWVDNGCRGDFRVWLDNRRHD